MQTLKLESKGKNVRFLQELLQKNGVNIPITETFDGDTRIAVINFQTAQGLDNDGIVGFRTWEALLFAQRRKENQPLTNEDYIAIGLLLDIEPAILRAIEEVETGGKGGFFAPGKPAILFEGHIFWNELKKRGIRPEDHRMGNEDILYPKWEKGHYKGGLAEYERLNKARAIHLEAANCSASWGKFQVMGFNHAACGESSVKTFVEKMCESELNQLLLTAHFLYQSHIVEVLREKDWFAPFARKYNGPAYKANNYDDKLAKAYQKYAIAF